jgi:RNA polymerase sigma factor (sigma-70 family)
MPPPADHLAARLFLGPALRAQPDRRLVDLVRNGYDAAFEEIVRRYRRPLDRFAAAIVGGRSEDVTQDAFSKALLALRGSEAEIELRPWLYRIVRNTALNDLRDRAPAAEELSEALPGGLGTVAEAETREELADLMERLRALPEPQRAAIVMRELEGLSHEEIAAALGVSGGAARQAIYRARTTLRDGFGLLVPLPVLRALVEHGEEAAVASGAFAAGAGASSAGGAVLGGFGGGAAAKVGVATVLVAGSVGAGVAIENRQGDPRGPEAAKAAPLPGGGDTRTQQVAEGSRGSSGSSQDSGLGGSGSDGRGSSGPGSGERDEEERRHRGDDSDRGDDDRRDDREGDDRSGREDGSRDQEDRSGRSGESSGGSVSSGSGSPDDDEGDDNSGSGSSGSGSSSESSGSRSSGSGSSDSSGSDSSGSDSSSGSGGGGSSGSSSGSGGGSSSGSGSEVAAPVPAIEPAIEEDDGNSSSGSGSSGSGDSDDD